MALGDMLIAHQNRIAAVDARQLIKHPLEKVSRRKPSYRNPTHLGSHTTNKNTQRASLLKVSQPSSRSAIAKPPDLDVVIRLTPVHLSLIQTTEAMLERWVDLCVDYYGLLAQHPSFPEAIAPLLFYIPRLLRCKVPPLTVASFCQHPNLSDHRTVFPALSQERYYSQSAKATGIILSCKRPGNLPASYYARSSPYPASSTYTLRHRYYPSR